MSSTALPTSTDVVVIGAGPAGVMSASLLHRAGHGVCVLERQRFPRFVIGESLLPRCMDLLDSAGLLEAVKRQGYLEKHGALFMRGDASCRFDFSEGHTPGWGYTWQVPRDHFDQVLADGLQAQGVPVFFEHTVTDARVGESPRVSVETPDGATHTIDCRFVVDASGYGRVLPRLLELNLPSDLPLRRSVFTHVKGDARPEGEDEGLIWITSHAANAWSWIIPFAGDRTSVGVVASPEFFEGHPSDPGACLKSIFDSDANTRARLGATEHLFDPHVIDGYSIGIKQLWGAGYCLVGNATEFLDPVFSSGVTLALESASRATEVLIRQLSGEPADWEAGYVTPISAAIEAFRHYVNWWYDGSLAKIFFAPNPNPEIKKKICSVLAGYVWDETNPFATEYERKVPQVLRLIEAAPAEGQPRSSH